MIKEFKKNEEHDGYGSGEKYNYDVSYPLTNLLVCRIIELVLLVIDNSNPEYIRIKAKYRGLMFIFRIDATMKVNKFRS